MGLRLSPRVIPRGWLVSGFVAALFVLVHSSSCAASTGGVYELSGCIPATGALMSGGTFLLVSSVAEPVNTTVGTNGVFSEKAGFLQDATFSPLPVALSQFVLE